MLPCFFFLFLKIALNFSRKISKTTNGHKAAAGQLVQLFMQQEVFLCLPHSTRADISVYTLQYTSFETMVQMPHTLNFRQTDRLHYIFRTQFCSNLPVLATVRQCCLSKYNRTKGVFCRLIPKFQISKHIRLTHSVKTAYTNHVT